MSKYRVTLFRTCTDLLSGVVEIETSETDPKAIVAAAAAAAKDKDVDWRFVSSLESGEIMPEMTTRLDVFKLEETTHATGGGNE